MGNFAGSLSNRVSEVSMGVNHSLWTILFDFWPVTVTLGVSLILLGQVHSGLALVLGSVDASDTSPFPMCSRCAAGNTPRCLQPREAQ